MNNALIYHFDSRTGQYLGSGQAEPCQLAPGEFLLPAFSTPVEPPAPATVPAGQAAFFDPVTSAWELRPLGVELPASPAPALSLPERQALLVAGVDLHLNGQAQALGYASIQTAVSYADEDAVPRFQHEGRALRRWRSLVYAACYQSLAAFEAGEIEEPTLAGLIERLPAFELPASEGAA
jgi:hypothetical protein